jgi:CheY-like chemotaxis protein
VRHASQPARILIYREPGAATSQALGDPALEDTLKKAGHSTTGAATAQDLERALSTSDYDLVLADYQMATTLRGQLGATVPGIRLVPVLDRDTRQFLSAAKREFKVVLNIPASVNSLLNAVDKAMALR